jgi:hypothetical protein
MLSEQDHSFGLDKAICFDLIEVDTARNTVAIIAPSIPSYNVILCLSRFSLMSVSKTTTQICTQEKEPVLSQLAPVLFDTYLSMIIFRA